MAYTATKSGHIIGHRGTVIQPVYKKNGYAVFSEMNGGKMRQTLIHRFIWEYFNGPIEGDLTVDHIDGVRANNELSNLRLMTRGANAAASCAKFTQEEVEDIKVRRASGISGRSLALEFGVAEQTICGIYKGRRY